MRTHEDIFNAETLSPEQQCRLLKSIYKALAGDPLDSDQPGIVRKVDEMHREIHGNDDPHSMGLKKKVDQLWEDRMKAIAICGFVGLTSGIAGWLLSFFFQK